MEDTNQTTEGLTKRQRRLLRKEERERGRENTKRKKKRNKYLFTIVVVVLIVGGVYMLANLNQNAPVGPMDYTKNDPSVGLADAPVLIEEYSDFQCPACKAAEPVVQSLLTDYEGHVRFVYNDFPLTNIHKNSFAAAEAAQCANDQGKFWEYHDILFDRQDSWKNEFNPDDKFFSYAEELGLDAIVFSTCVDERKFKGDVNDDMAEGRKRNINSTPTFFINGERIVGGDQLANSRGLIDSLLAK